MRIVENRASGYGKLIAAWTALKLIARLQPRGPTLFAAWALDAFWPAELCQYLAALFIGRVGFEHI